MKNEEGIRANKLFTEISESVNITVMVTGTYQQLLR